MLKVGKKIIKEKQHSPAISDRKDMATFEPTVLPAMQPTETIGIQICFILS